MSDKATEGGANEAPWRSPPYAFYVVAIAIASASTIFILSMWIFADLFTNATAVTAALGSLFTLIGTVVGAYFGIKVSNDTAERAHSAIERAQDRVTEANERGERSHNTAEQALSELPPDVARRIKQG